MDTYEPVQSEEFRRKYSGMKAKRTIDNIGKFGELKNLHKLQIRNSSNKVVYEEKFVTEL